MSNYRTRTEEMFKERSGGSPHLAEGGMASDVTKTDKRMAGGFFDRSGAFHPPLGGNNDAFYGVPLYNDASLAGGYFDSNGVFRPKMKRGGHRNK